MTSIEKYSDRIFENIKQINEYGQEFWYARELQEVFVFFFWRKNFRKCLNKSNGEIFMKLFKERLYHVKTAVMI